MKPWTACYDLSWKGLIVPEAFSHPAKFARGLIERIVRHGLAHGWFKPGDVVGDPFGGVALGGIVCGYHGLNWVGVELEEKFVDLGNRNLALHGLRWMNLEGGASVVTLLQGDSRRFAELVRPAAIVTSPPYADSDQNYAAGWTHIDPAKAVHNRHSRQREADYGSSPGHIGSLPAGELGAVLTSPPYADMSRDSGTDLHPERAEGTFGRGQMRDGYGDAAGQIASLPPGDLSAVVTSPPYEASLTPGNKNELRDCKWSKIGGGQMKYRQRYSADTDGQIGNAEGETYWQAMAQVYAQCRQALRPGGVLVCVVKDYVKNKQRVPLSDQTLSLLLHLGFEPVDRFAAMLVSEQTHLGLFNGEPIVQRKSRKSFFRRLAEKKGSPAIDHEDVLVVRKGDA